MRSKASWRRSVVLPGPGRRRFLALKRPGAPGGGAHPCGEGGLPPMHTPFATPIGYYSRCFIMATLVPTWRDPAKNARSRALFGRIIDRCAEHGWGSYRTAPAVQDEALSKYSYNNSSLLRFQEKLKDGIGP